MPNKPTDPNNTNRRYVEAQLEGVFPFSTQSGKNGQVQLKLHSGKGETNWLSLDVAAQLEITRVLHRMASHLDANNL